jgi:hypothetical protein
MKQNLIKTSYDPNRLLDSVMHRLGLNSDRELSRKLHVTLQVIARIRSGRLPIGASMLLWISECTGDSINELRHILGDRRARARLNCTLVGRRRAG